RHVLDDAARARLKHGQSFQVRTEPDTAEIVLLDGLDEVPGIAQAGRQDMRGHNARIDIESMKTGYAADPDPAMAILHGCPIRPGQDMCPYAPTRSIQDHDRAESYEEDMPVRQRDDLLDMVVRNVVCSYPGRRHRSYPGRRRIDADEALFAVGKPSL